MPVAVPGTPLEDSLPAAQSWRAVTRVLRSCAAAGKVVAADLLHAVLPSSCRLCEGPMLGLLPVRVCDSCLAQVRAMGSPDPATMCSRCGEDLGMESARFARALGATECTPCRRVPPPFSKAVSFAPYDEGMRDLLHLLKFGGLPQLAEHVLGEWLAEAVLRLDGHAASQLILVPVPMFAERERRRGYNQAALLAKAAARVLARVRPDWQFEVRPEALQRVRDTNPLHAQRPDERRRGLARAFRVREADAVRGKQVVLIDDILTTGATARECARVLLDAGAAAVWVATVARAQPEAVREIESSVARWDGAPLGSSGQELQH